MTLITKDINSTISELKKGNVVGLPTETVYGLGANGLNKNAVLKIFEIKKRPHFNPLILHIYSINDISTYAKKIPDEVFKLAECYSPGPLTFVLNKKSIVPDIVTAGLDSVAIRFPSHTLFREVLKKVKFPIAAPSANMFGRISPVTAKDVYKELNNKIKYILDGGKCKVGIESTVISFLDDEITILRPGYITKKDIERVIGKKLKVNNLSVNKYRSPGLLKNHYSPITPLYLINDIKILNKISNKSFGFIEFSNYKSLKSVAANLFRDLRKADEMKYEFLFIKKVENIGLGIAINDRIQKASYGYAEIINNKIEFFSK